MQGEEKEKDAFYVKCGCREIKAFIPGIWFRGFFVNDRICHSGLLKCFSVREVLVFAWNWMPIELKDHMEEIK